MLKKRLLCIVNNWCNNTHRLPYVSTLMSVLFLFSFHKVTKRKKAAVEAEESETDGSPVKKKRVAKKKGWYFLIIITLQLCYTGRAAMNIQSNCYRLFVSIVPLLFAELVKLIVSWRYFQWSPAVQLKSIYHLRANRNVSGSETAVPSPLSLHFSPLTCSMLFRKVVIPQLLHIKLFFLKLKLYLIQAVSGCFIKSNTHFIRNSVQKHPASHCRQTAAAFLSVEVLGNVQMFGRALTMSS